MTDLHPVTDPPRLGLYVHFPWCVKKCPYCDFNSHPLTGNLDEAAYVQAVTREFREKTAGLDAAIPVHAGTPTSNQSRSGKQLAAHAWRSVDCGAGRVFDSVFLGGGTPSLFSARALGELLDQFRPSLRDGAEITMEANPGAAERDDLGAYREAGINRLSIGAQSFSAARLKRLGRIHGPDEVHACMAAARASGFDNINLDLMYALPGQATEDALADLKTAIALSPDHLSWYQLTIEPHTEFARRPPRNLPGEEAIHAMETAGRALLGEHAFTRYEISAYARPGRECRHNLVYWTFGDYLGLGAGAHGKLGRKPTVRMRNPRQPRLYLQNPLHSEALRVDPGELPGEFMMNALRLVGGVEQGLFEARTGLVWEAVQPTWERLTALGLTEKHRIAASERGLQHLDTLVQHFL